MPFPRAETTPPVTKMNRVSGRLWGIQALGVRVYRPGGRKAAGGFLKKRDLGSRFVRDPLAEALSPPVYAAAASSCCACLRAAPSEASAPSIRISSSTTPSPASASTVVRAVEDSEDFSIRK